MLLLLWTHFCTFLGNFGTVIKSISTCPVITRTAGRGKPKKFTHTESVEHHSAQKVWLGLLEDRSQAFLFQQLRLLRAVSLYLVGVHSGSEQLKNFTLFCFASRGREVFPFAKLLILAGKVAACLSEVLSNYKILLTHSLT